MESLARAGDNGGKELEFLIGGRNQIVFCPEWDETNLNRAPIDKLDEPEREQAWIEIERQLSRLEGPHGIEMPGEFLIGVGTK